MEDKFKKPWWDREATINGILASPLAFMMGGPLGLISSIACGIMCDKLDERDRKKAAEEYARTHKSMQQIQEEEQKIKELDIKIEREKIFEKEIEKIDKITIIKGKMKCGHGIRHMEMKHLPVVGLTNKHHYHPNTYNEIIWFGYQNDWGWAYNENRREDPAMIFTSISKFILQLNEDLMKGEEIKLYIPLFTDYKEPKFLYKVTGDKTWRVYEEYFTESRLNGTTLIKDFDF